MKLTTTPVVQVEDIRVIDNKGSLKAFASIVIGNGFKIYGLRVIEPVGKRPWVSLPQTESTSPDGKKKFWPVVELPDRVKRVVDDVVLRAFEEKRAV
jgi:DNA-binding cell septation regulator SpoVG